MSASPVSSSGLVVRRRTLGRYVLFDEIGSGGMATVHLGRMQGDGGFSRTVAIKRLHAHCARDPQFATLFLDEARLAGRVRHPNVAAMLDVVAADDELLLVMEYIHGEPLSRLMALAQKDKERVPPRIAVAVLVGVLHGLHAAHEACSETGTPLGIVHRDVSPQNILVGSDGVARLVDFGVAKAASRLQTTAEGQIKGKLAYMPPEQIQGLDIDRRVDVYAAAVVLWEALAGRRLFAADNPGSIVARVLDMPVVPPSKTGAEVPGALDDAVMRGLSRSPEERHANADAMATALELALAPATAREVAQWVASIAGDRLAARAKLVSAVERAAMPSSPSSAPEQAVPEGSAAAPAAQRSSRARPIAAGAVLAAAVAALAGIGLRSARRAEPIAPASAAAAPAASSAVAVESVVPSGPTPSDSEAPSAPAPSATASSATKKAAPAPAPVHRHRAPATSCNPPYTLDPSDPRIHVPKPECM